MSNANYCASAVTQRRQTKAIASSFINRIQNGSQSTTSYGPLQGNFDQSVVQAVISGQQTQYRRSEENCVVVDPGCPCGVASISSPVTGCGPVNYNSYWATNITGTDVEQAYSTTVSSCGNTYVVGYYSTTSLITPGQITFNSFALPQPGGGVVNQTLFGTLTAPSVNETAFVAKYDVNGVVQWATHLGLTTGTGAAVAFGVAVDANDNVYVIGSSTTSSTTPLSVFSYSGLLGTAIQVSLYGTFPVPTNSGAVFLVKYDTNGQAQWATKLDSTAGFDEGLSVAVDSAANVYITGYYASQTVSGDLDVYTVVNTATPINITSYGLLANTFGSGQAAFVAKYNTDGVTQWATSILHDSTDATVQGNGVAVDSNGNVYVIGTYRRTVATSFTVTFNNFVSQAPTINVALYGTINSSNNLGNIFIVKYDTNGQVQWVTNMTGLGDDNGNAIAVDTAGDVYVTGMFQSTITLNTFVSQGSPINLTAYGTLQVVAGNQAVFVAKYSTNGQSISWVARIDNLNNDVGYGIAVDTSGNTYVCGTTQPSVAQPVVTFWSFASQGTPINLNANNTLTIASGGIVTGTSGFLVKYDSTGTVQWATSLTRTTSPSNVRPSGIALDPNGNIHVAGYYQEFPLLINNYASGTLPMLQTAYGTLPNTGASRETFIVKYDPTGQII